MSLTDPSLQTALDAAADKIGACLMIATRQVNERLAALAQTAGRIADRDALNAAHFELRRHGATLHRDFERALLERIADDLAPAPAGRRSLAGADWHDLSLVDEREMDDRMAGDRLGQQITRDAEEPMRELEARLGALLRRAGVVAERNPLRGEVLGGALHRAITAVSKEADVGRLLTREFGAALAGALPGCLREIVAELERRGVQPLGLSVRQTDGPGHRLDGLHSAYETLDSRQDGLENDAAAFGARAPGEGQDRGGRSSRLADIPDEGDRHGRPDAARGDEPHPADLEWMALLRELSALEGAGPDASGFASTRRGASSAGADSGAGQFRASGRRDAATERAFLGSGGGLTGLMAVNLIRAYRDRLMRAGGGRLDPMVIDLIGSLFDQILSDARVPPQMARQIARLQLPVLRVALSDPSFFSSRRHPVRRFVDRVASLACAFDDFDDGPGRLFLDRVRGLVDEIVEGDFDQVGLYASKLGALETFNEEQAQRDLQPRGTVATLGAKENELRLQQRYALQLQAALQPVAMEGDLRDFLSQVWSQALVVAAQRDGAESDRSTRYRRVGRDLVMSVQPKGSPPLRKRFLMQLPGLMKDLNEGLALVGWPAEAQRELMARLQPAHAASLKAPPISELDHNLLARQLEQIFAAPQPGQDSLTAADPVPDLAAEAIARRFTPEEAERVGLLSENAVDWARDVDIDLGAAGAFAGAAPVTPEPFAASAVPAPVAASAALGPVAASAALGPVAASAARAPEVDIDLDFGAPPAAEAPAGAPAGTTADPHRGGALIDHLKLGFAYQMQLKNSWQKVRLAHVSPGRGFFVFTAGRRHQETISMTSRMLARMCATGRFQVVENRYLVERATQRARQQLAAMAAGSAPA